MARHRVALGGEADDRANTLALSGVDVVVPLERDLDDDPLQDDEVRLVALAGGALRELLASDPDVTADEENGLLLYHFRDVPPGLYDVEVKVGSASWSTVLSRMLVTRSGAVHGDRALGETPEEVPERTVPGIDPGEPEEGERAPSMRFVEDAGDESE